MRALTDREILDVWEGGLAVGPARWSPLLLAAAEATLTGSEFERLTLGQLNRLLLEFQALMFGACAPGFSNCVRCDEPLEFVVPIDVLLQAGGSRPRGESTIDVGGYTIEVRPVRWADVVSVEGERKVASVHGWLLRACVIAAAYAGRPVSADELPAPIVTKIAATLAESDPLAEILLNVSCPACGYAWQLQLDVARFLWMEFSALAERLLREVHTLARVYGWGEEEILRLSSRRRQSYLELVGA
jgi:hypothetical protein